ncbi:MAG: hypothetical protein QM760_16590 [Nibricoccus sp.]
MEDFGADLDRAADAAGGRGGIEGGADFVVNVRGTEFAEGGEGGAELALHVGGGEGAGESGDAEGLESGVAGELIGRGRVEEEDGARACAGKEFKGVGRAGEVVAVVGEEEVGGGRGAHCLNQ